MCGIWHPTLPSVKPEQGSKRKEDRAEGEQIQAQLVHLWAVSSTKRVEAFLADKPLKLRS